MLLEGLSTGFSVAVHDLVVLVLETAGYGREFHVNLDGLLLAESKDYHAPGVLVVEGDKETVGGEEG